MSAPGGDLAAQVHGRKRQLQACLGHLFVFRVGLDVGPPRHAVELMTEIDRVFREAVREQAESIEDMLNLVMVCTKRPPQSFALQMRKECTHEHPGVDCIPDGIGTGCATIVFLAWPPARARDCTP